MRLRLRLQSGLPEKGLDNRFEAAPFDDAENFLTPGRRFRGPCLLGRPSVFARALEFRDRPIDCRRFRRLNVRWLQCNILDR